MSFLNLVATSALFPLKNATTLYKGATLLRLRSSLLTSFSCIYHLAPHQHSRRAVSVQWWVLLVCVRIYDFRLASLLTPNTILYSGTSTLPPTASSTSPLWNLNLKQSNHTHNLDRRRAHTKLAEFGGGGFE